MKSLPESIYPALFQKLPDGVFLIDPQTSRILDCNEAALRQVGMARDEVLDQSVLSLQKDVVGAEQWASIAQAIRNINGFIFIGAHRHKNGADVPVEVNTSAFTFEGQEYFLSVARNITERVALESDLDSRDVQLLFALSDASDGLWDWNLQTDEVFFSPQLSRMLGYGPHEMKPTLATWLDNLHPEDAQGVRTNLEDHLQGRRERYVAEYRLRNRNGHYLWVHDRGRICSRDAQGQATRVVGMVQNITDRKQLELTLQNIASHDPLTGLLNRHECDHVLRRQLELCRRLKVPMGLCIFDLDHFKQVNDQFGHAVGDKVLQQVAHTTATQLRSYAPQTTCFAGAVKSSCCFVPTRRSTIFCCWQGNCASVLRKWCGNMPAYDRSLPVASAWPIFPTTREMSRACSSPPTLRCTGPSHRGATVWNAPSQWWPPAFRRVSSEKCP